MTAGATSLESLSKAELIRALQARESALESHQSQLESARAKIAYLEEQLRLALHRQYGRRSEARSNDAQADLFNEAETLETTEAPAEAQGTEQADTETVTYQRRKPHGRRPLPDHLPRETIEHDLPEADKVCACGCTKTRIGEDVSERLEYIPARLYVERHIRPRYACRGCEEGVQVTPRPPALVPKSNAGPGLLAFVLIGKYQDALPLYRQEQIFKRHGIDLPRQTLAHWVIAASQALQPLLERLEAHLITCPVLLMDETPLQVNHPGEGTAPQRAQMWIRRGQSPPDERHPRGRDITLYHYSPDRSARTAGELLAGYTGALMTDAYPAYIKVAAQYGLQHAYCLAHARRQFVEAEKALPKGKSSPVITAVLNKLRKLYAIEHRLKDASASEKVKVRQTEAKPVLEQLQAYLEKKADRVPPKSALGKAIHYMLKHWNGLTQYLINGHLPIDNNGAENGLRPFVIGRKNWLFADTARGAQASARWYSLIETAKANGLEPYAYLKALFKRLPEADSDEELDRLLPWNLADADLA